MNRSDFPVLINHPDLVYLDSANTSLKPKPVINSVIEYYTDYTANIARTSYSSSEKATRKFNESRQLVANLVGSKPDEIIFTYSTTYALNQVAEGAKHQLKKDDIILLTHNEHNSNLLVWQTVARDTGAQIKFVDDINQADISSVKIFSYSSVSNLTGEVFDYSDLVTQIKSQGGLISVDASQAIAHMPISVDRLNCDFLSFSSHKIYGPSGVGVLYIKKSLQSSIAPLVYGSQTFSSISDDKFELLDGPAKFEPGTPNIEGVIGLGAAIKYILSIDLAKIADYDKGLMEYYYERVAHYNLGRFVVKKPAHQIGVCSLDHPSVHPHDIAMLLDQDNISVRAGKACADMMINRLNKPRGVLRASFGIYTTRNDIDKYLASYRKAIDTLNG